MSILFKAENSKIQASNFKNEIETIKTVIN